ncbi:MAG TPA: hypothetical protein VF515_21170 [Candidatus Binatia bacterium]
MRSVHHFRMRLAARNAIAADDGIDHVVDGAVPQDVQRGGAALTGGDHQPEPGKAQPGEGRRHPSVQAELPHELGSVGVQPVAGAQFVDRFWTRCGSAEHLIQGEADRCADPACIGGWVAGLHQRLIHQPNQEGFAVDQRAIEIENQQIKAAGHQAGC